VKKQFLLGAAIGALSVINPALAAPPAYNWTGCYIGGNAGYSWGRASGATSTPSINSMGGGSLPLGLPTWYPISLNPEGVIGGGQIGCNRQFDNRYVFGFETDFQGSAQHDSNSRNHLFNDGEGASGTVNQNVEAKLKWFGTVRGRAGLLITPSVMVYGTGGLAYGNISVNNTFTVSGTTFSGVASFGDSKTKIGWTLGAGIEGVLFNWNNWTWKIEYLYIDFGSLSGSGVDPLIGPYSWNVNVIDNIVRVGLNYRITP
jgi:outer membrane immunogenic protein